jgi:rare lipoprotein A
VHRALRLVERDADVPHVREPVHTWLRRARTAWLVTPVIVVLAATGVAAAADGSGDVGDGPLVELGSVDEGMTAPPVAPPAASGVDLDGGDASSSVDPALVDPTAAPEDAPIAGTDTQLVAERARLAAERDAAQQQLLRHEGIRQAAEADRDVALQQVAGRLVALFDAGEEARLRALMEARDIEDVALRGEAVAALHPLDRDLLRSFDDADRRANGAGVAADTARSTVLALGTRIAAIDAVIESREAPTADELARARGERHSFDADLVFATGPIPGIGYWGAVNGGSMLDGWSGYVGAAIGGIGCTPPDPSMQASGSVEQGEASWYGPGFQGNPTANGEPFDTNEMTAAHRTLPFGTIVRVYSSTTARCAFVRINDRGPYVDGRVIDLSRAAADAIGMESVAPVQLEVFAPAGQETAG